MVFLRALLLPALAAIVVATVGIALGHGRPSASTSAPKTSRVITAKTVRIKIHNYAYSPVDPTVKAGTRFTVLNTDQTAHTLTANSRAFDTGTIQPGQTKTFTVNKPGVYPYHCEFHAFMTGTITVVK